MNYREVRLLARKDYSADDTEEIELDMKDPISKIQICYEGLNTGASPTAHPAKMITDITLKDGSDILYSLTGQQAQAADFYNNNKEPANILFYSDDWYNEMIYGLNFGRYLWDTEIALDPSFFSNLKLSISIDIDAGGQACDAGKMTVTASCFDDKQIKPVGFFTHKEHKSYTGGSATHKRVDLPVDNAYRMLFWKCQKAGTGPEYLYDTIKLEEDAGKRIPFDITGYELIRHVQAQWKPYIEWMEGSGDTTTTYYYITPGYWPGAAMAQWATTNGYHSFYSGDGGRCQIDSNATGPNWQALVRGWCPHSTLCYPFGLQNDLTDWYEMEKIESLVCDTLSLSGGSSQTYEIFSQQFRRY